MKDRTFIIFCVCLMAALWIGSCEYRNSQSAIKTANKVETCMVYPPDTIHLERATTYQPTEAQCDSNPLTTADGSKINPDYYQKWVALSRDLLTRWGGQFDYGDTLEIYSEKNPNLNGQWEVHDCMAPSYKMSIDFLLEPEKNYPKLGVGKDVKILYCGYEK